jgi:hypothetical protein
MLKARIESAAFASTVARQMTVKILRYRPIHDVEPVKVEP